MEQSYKKPLDSSIFLFWKKIPRKQKEEDGDLVVEEEETPPATTTTPPALTTTPPATTTTDIPDPATYVLAPVNTDPLRDS